MKKEEKCLFRDEDFEVVPNVRKNLGKLLTAVPNVPNT